LLVNNGVATSVVGDNNIWTVWHRGCRVY